MIRKDPPKPTDAELAILQVLWATGPCTVREVCDALNKGRPTGYTTVLKLLQIMASKGLVRRDESQRSHVYEAIYSEEKTQRQLLSHLLDRAFRGSGAKLVMQALSTKPSSHEELSEIRAFLDELEEESS